MSLMKGVQLAAKDSCSDRGWSNLIHSYSNSIYICSILFWVLCSVECHMSKMSGAGCCAGCYFCALSLLWCCLPVSAVGDLFKGHYFSFHEKCFLTAHSGGGLSNSKALLLITMLRFSPNHSIIDHVFFFFFFNWHITLLDARRMENQIDK